MSLHRMLMQLQAFCVHRVKKENLGVSPQNSATGVPVWETKGGASRVGVGSRRLASGPGASSNRGRSPATRGTKSSRSPEVPPETERRPN